MKLNKVPDIFGITAEHMRLASPVLLDILLHIANDTIAKGVLPDSFKIRSVCSVLKKLKPAKNPDNYCRITITAIVGKILRSR